MDTIVEQGTLGRRIVELQGSNQGLQKQPLGERGSIVLTDAALNLNAPERSAIDRISDRRIELDFGLGFEGRLIPRSASVQGLVSLWGLDVALYGIRT